MLARTMIILKSECLVVQLSSKATLDKVYGVASLRGSIKLQVSFAKEPYKRDVILQKRPIIQSILLTVATPYL